MNAKERARNFLRQCAPQHRDREWHKIIEDLLVSEIRPNSEGKTFFCESWERRAYDCQRQCDGCFRKQHDQNVAPSAPERGPTNDRTLQTSAVATCLRCKNALDGVTQYCPDGGLHIADLRPSQSDKDDGEKLCARCRGAVVFDPTISGRQCPITLDDCRKAYMAGGCTPMNCIIEQRIMASQSATQPSNWAERLRAKLKEASKGEQHTWGFVAMFMEMIGEVEKEIGATEDGKGNG